MSPACRFVFFVWVLSTAYPALSVCPSERLPSAQLQQLRINGFAVADNDERNRLAIAMLDCIGNPDPLVRDATVFTGLSKWLRGRELTADTIRVMHADLVDQMAIGSDDSGFRRPFAILVLSEIARADRLDGVLADSQRAALVELASEYLEGVRDYRGFRDGEGWRHGVAHGADLVLQLSLNPKIGGPLVGRLMNAISRQIAPGGAVYYVHGESERLARAVFFAHGRGILDARFWNGWFAALADPSPLSAWTRAFESEAGLARRHNILAFLLNLKFAAGTGNGAPGRELETRADAAIERVIGG